MTDRPMTDLERAVAALEAMRDDVNMAIAAQRPMHTTNPYLSGMRTAYNISLLTLRSISHSESLTVDHLRDTLNRVLSGGGEE